MHPAGRSPKPEAIVPTLALAGPFARIQRRELGFLNEYFPAAEAQRQFDTAVDWGRYAELFEYDAVEERLTLESNVTGSNRAPIEAK